MKKTQRFLLLCGMLFSALCFFFGCSSSETPETTERTSSNVTDDSFAVTQSNQESLTADVGAVLDTFGESSFPDGIVYENETYRIERIGGKCYLSFLQGTGPQKLVSGGCVRHTDNILFDSVDEMIECFTQTGLQEYSLQQICTFYLQDESGKYRILDPYHFFVPVLPNFKTPGYVLYRTDGLTFRFLAPKKGQNVDYYMSFSFVSEDQYERGVNWIQDYGSLDLEYTVSHEAERDATVYSKKSERGHYCKKHYVLQEGKKTVYVSESYWLERYDGTGTASKTVPTEISVYGTDGMVFFYVSSKSIQERPTVEWLLSIESVPYVLKSQSQSD